jgi:hypothetical protein
MAGKDKNIRTTLSGFLRYRGKGMSNRERNAFERELEKDTFAGEAADGLSGMTPEEVKEDLATLQKRLKARSTGKHRLIYYRIAASVAVLMVISSVFIVIQRNKPEKQIGENVKSEEHFDILKSPALKEPTLKEDKKIALNEPKSAYQKMKGEPPLTKKNDSIDIIADEKLELPVVSEANKNATIPERKEAEIVKIMVEQPDAMAKAAFEKKEAAGAVSTIRSENIDQIISYTPPQPVNGKENFDKYIEENIRRPADAKPGEMVVVVSFKVKSTGIRGSIKIISSPGKSFSDEAIRLIKSGPSWKPAEKNGKITEDDIKVTIIFK